MFIFDACEAEAKFKVMVTTQIEKTNYVRDAVDTSLLAVLSQKRGTESFSDFLNSVLLTLEISVEDFTKDELSILGRENSFCDMIYIWFYLNKLESMKYIAFGSKLSIKEMIRIGKSNTTQRGYLPKEISGYIKQHIDSVIVVSPELEDYVNAGHISQELKMARRSARMAIIAVILSAASILISIFNSCCC